MRVFRVESREDGKCGIYGLSEAGVEPYRYTRRPVCSPDYSEHHANPFFDKGLRNCPYVNPLFRAIHPAMHCAFESIEQLHKWFPPSRLCDMHHEAGHIVGLSEYEVDEQYVQKGDKQVLFALSKAQKVAVHNVNEYSENCPDPD